MKCFPAVAVFGRRNGPSFLAALLLLLAGATRLGGNQFSSDFRSAQAPTARISIPSPPTARRMFGSTTRRFRAGTPPKRTAAPRLALPIIVASTGQYTTGALYSFGVAGVHSVGDRALGSIASDPTGTIAYGVRFTNDTGVIVGNFTISYTGEQWRNGGNTATQTLAFSYRISNTPITNPDPLNTNAWVSFSLLSFNSPTVGATAAALDGNAATNRQVFSGVLLPGAAVQPGQEIFLRWVDVNDRGQRPRAGRGRFDRDLLQRASDQHLLGQRRRGQLEHCGQLESAAGARRL